MGKDKTWKLDQTLKIDDEQLKTPKHDQLCLWVDNHINEIIQKCLMKRFKKYVQFIEAETILLWEEPIKNDKGFVVGIPDFKFCFSVWDGKTYFNDNKNITHYGGIIEVKPKIRSVGETMRQLKLYKSYGNYFFTQYDNNVNLRDAIIVTGTPEYKDIFEKQKIHYFVVTDEMLKGGV